MKKLIMTLGIVLGLGLTTFAGPNDGGLFQRGATDKNDANRVGVFPSLPGQHGLEGNQDGNSPLGTGIAVLTALGAAYLIGKRRNED